MTAESSRPRGGLAPVPAARLGTDAGYVFGAQLLSIVLGFVVTAVASRNLPAADFASLSWALSWLAWLVLCAQLGMTQASTVLLAVDGGPALRPLLGPIIRTVLQNAILVAAVWIVLVGPLVAGASEDGDVYRSVVPYVGLWVPAAATGLVVGGILRGLHRFRAGAVYGEYLRRLILLVTLGAVIVADGGREVTAVLAVAVVVESVLALAAVGWLRHTAPAAGVTTAPTTTRALRRRGADFVLPTIDAPLLPQAGVWILALVAAADEVALLSVAIGISFVYGLPVFTGARVLGPRYARAHGRGDALAALEPTARLHALGSTAFVAAAMLGLVLVGEPLTELAFGEAYGEAARIAVILGFGALVNAATGSCSAALVHSGQERIVGAAAVGAAVTYLVLGLALGTVWGAEGVALAASIVLGVRNLALAAVTRHRLGLTTWVGFRTS